MRRKKEFWAGYAPALKRASIAASAASALEPSGPPACAMSGRPPPPLPPSASAPALHEIDGAPRLGQVVGDADGEARLAVLGDADDGDDAGADLLLAVVDEAAQILRVEALHGAREELHVADAAHAGRPPAPARRGAAAERDLLLGVGELALELLASPRPAPCTRSTTSSGRVFRTAAASLRRSSARRGRRARRPPSAPRCGARRPSSRSRRRS